MHHTQDPGRLQYSQDIRAAWIVVALAAPFYLNDFANLWVRSWPAWLAIDYAFVKLLPLAAMAWLLARGWLQPAQLGLVRQPLPAFALTFLAAALLGTLLDQNGYALVARLPGYAPLGGMPDITSPAWNWFDLLAGLFLVGWLEELLFRALAYDLLRRRTARPAVIVAGSALAFGLIHWSLGLHAVLVTAAIGAVFMVIYMRTRSVPALALAHFAVNFIDFAGVVPKKIFQFI